MVERSPAGTHAEWRVGSATPQPPGCPLHQGRRRCRMGVAGQLCEPPVPASPFACGPAAAAQCCWVCYENNSTRHAAGTAHCRTALGGGGGMLSLPLRSKLKEVLRTSRKLGSNCFPRLASRGRPLGAEEPAGAGTARGARCSSAALELHELAALARGVGVGVHLDLQTCCGGAAHMHGDVPCRTGAGGGAAAWQHARGPCRHWVAPRGGLQESGLGACSATLRLRPPVLEGQPAQPQ